MSEKHYAVLDIGSNSFHIVIAQKNPRNGFTIIDREKAILRLSTTTLQSTTFIKKSDIEKGVRLVKRFKDLADKYKADMKIVATSAVREAQNRNDFTSKVYDETGLTIDVIDGLQEAAYIYNAVNSLLKLNENRILCIDIGGGSTEFYIGENGETIYSTSLKIGAVRLTKKFFPDFTVKKDGVLACNYYIEGQLDLIKNDILKAGFEFAVFSSGTAKNILTLCNTLNDKKNAGVKMFELNNLQTVYKKVLGAKTVEDRMKLPGLEPGRADIIPAGVIVFSKIFYELHLHNAYFSDYALREGVLLEMIN